MSCSLVDRVLRQGDILHATDFSPEAMLAFGASCALAREMSSRLVIAHVHERPLGADDDCSAPDAAFHHQLDMLASRARAAGIARVVTRLTHGHAWHRIVDLARVERCALIVMGMRGRSGDRHTPIGRVAEEVTRNASCSVLIVRPRESGAEAA